MNSSCKDNQTKFHNQGCMQCEEGFEGSGTFKSINDEISTRSINIQKFRF